MMNNKKIRQFYNKTPYPYVPPFLKYGIRKNFFEKMCIDTGRPIPEKPEILILGCGVASSRAIRLAYPEASIWSVDISENSIKKSMEYCGKKIAKTINWINCDIESDELIEKLENKKFHWIHCTGVLQLPKNTFKTIENLSNLLRDDGIVRFLFYSKGARFLIEFARIAFLKNGVNDESSLKRYMKTLPKSHPFYFTLATYTETLHREGVMDGFLVPQLYFYYLDEWEEMFKKNGLTISKIDTENYSEGVEEYFPDKFRKKVVGMGLIEKITLLEKLGEWRTDFTGILTKNKIENENMEFSNKQKEILENINISKPRSYLWYEFKSGLKIVGENLEKEELNYIFEKLYERRWVNGVSGFLSRIKWRSWDDKSRLNSSNSYIFSQRKKKLLEDFNESPYMKLSPFEEWKKEEWIDGLLSW